MDTIFQLTMMALGVGAVVYIVIPALLKILLRWYYLKKVRENGCVCITFDDGPSPETTGAILDILNERGIRATFFMLGKYAEKYPELVHRILDEGHDIGSHGYSHTHAWKTMPGDTYRDLMRGYRLFKRYKKPGRPCLFRPPFGKLNAVSLWYLIRTKSMPVFWDVDPQDYRQATSAGIAASVMRDLAPGSTVLFHDGIGHKEGDTRVTIPALHRVLSQQSVGSLTFKTVSDALFTPPRTV